jgi:predicted N-acyltransferase
MTQMRVTVADSIADIPAAEWNEAAGNDCPFLRHAFFLAAETNGDVSPESGWTPQHLVLRGDHNELRAALPLYQKDHSWGEFVFDWAWARAYEQANIEYYPKLVSAVPFTPATGHRLMLRDPSDTEAATVLLQAAIELATQNGCSSVHVLFPDSDDLPVLGDAGFRLRKDCQFHWHNRDYGNFDDFLATFSAAKRKKARRERRRVAEAGISFRHLRAADVDEQTWHVIYELISNTFMRRGSLPYFSLDFFIEIGRTMPEAILIVLAECDGDPVAAAVFFESATTLYGRYWGCKGYYDALHFETCYYQGIEYCIQTQKAVFEPGTQGEHKISRGFVPVTTWSAHWLLHPEFFSAIGNYLDEEQRHVERYMQAVDAHSPYKSRHRA